MSRAPKHRFAGLANSGRLAAFEAMGGATADKADARMGASVGGKGKLSERPARLDRQQAGDARMQRGRGDSYLDSKPKL